MTTDDSTEHVTEDPADAAGSPAVSEGEAPAGLVEIEVLAGPEKSEGDSVAATPDDEVVVAPRAPTAEQTQARLDALTPEAVMRHLEESGWTRGDDRHHALHGDEACFTRVRDDGETDHAAVPISIHNQAARDALGCVLGTSAARDGLDFDVLLESLTA